MPAGNFAADVALRRNEKLMSSRVYTIPNLLSMLRMALIPVFASLLYYGKYELALVIFVAAALSDTFDGFVARRFKQESALGSIIDPIADKLLMTTAFIMLTMPRSFDPVRHLPIPFWVTATVIGRDILIITSAAAINFMTGFRDFRPSLLGKMSTVVQVIAIALILIASISHVTIFLPTTYVIVVFFAVVSGIHYIFQVAGLMKDNENQNS
jgi:cardiolipin synthase